MNGNSPNVNGSKGWNKGEPGFDGSFDFFEEWIEQDVTDMVRRDRNHPSIFLWSIGNEVDYPNDPIPILFLMEHKSTNLCLVAISPMHPTPCVSE